MSDILLVNTPIARTRPIADPDESVPPIGIGYIYTQLSRSGYQCQFVDANVGSMLPQDIVRLINEADAEYVGLNVFSSNLTIIRHIVESAEPRKKFLLGGPAVRFLVPEIKQWNPSGTITVVVGESELILPDILGGRVPLESVSPNVDVAVVSPDSRYYPSTINLPLDRAIFVNEPIRRRDLGVVESHIIASRGCQYDCAFCTAARSLGPETRARFRSYDSLAEEIEAIKARYPDTNCIRVLDDLYLRNANSIELAAKLFRQYGLRWRSMAHINTFHELPARWLGSIRDSGCRELFVGVESGNDETLKHIRKPFLAATAYSTVCRLIDAGIAVKCYFILGFPGETESAASDTIRLAHSLRDHAAIVGIPLRISAFRFRPYHGTSLYEELRSKGVAMTPIVSRADTTDDPDCNPYDCVSGVYAQYGEEILNSYMAEMERLAAPP